MAKRTSRLRPSELDGINQAGRTLAALDPAHAPLDGRDTADLLAFAQALARKLRFFDDHDQAAGDWSAFLVSEDVDLDDVTAYVRDPERFSGDEAHWLGRPHFALFLTFLELLGHARSQLNGLTRRHLDYFYREVLRLSPRPAVPDRAAVVFRLAPGAEPVRLPAGTRLRAGKERTYATDRELVVSRASVVAVRSLALRREVTGIPDVRQDRSLTGPEAVMRTLSLALGEPGPGDPLPRFRGAAIDFRFVVDLGDLLDFAALGLHLEHHELRAMMRLVRRRAAADREWAAINALLGVADPADPRDFLANLTDVVGPLDFAADGLPLVGDVDDLYTLRNEPEVRAYIDSRLAPIGYQRFVALMHIKRRIDADWAEVNRLLQRAGRRKRGLLAYELPVDDPADFAANLGTALDGGPSVPWPWNTSDIVGYDAALREVEAIFGAPAERLRRIAALAASLRDASDAASPMWPEVDRILAAAHRERFHAARRRSLAQARGDDKGLDGLDAVLRRALAVSEESTGWDILRPRLAASLAPSDLELIDRFRNELVDPHAVGTIGWDELNRVAEIAQTAAEGIPEPVARIERWLNLAWRDNLRAVGPGLHVIPGQSPEPTPVETLGWAVSSSLLSLSQGRRTIVLTLGFRPEGFDRAALERALARKGLRVQVSTTKEWIELPIADWRVAAGVPGDDYWSLTGLSRNSLSPRPALRLEVVVDADVASLAPIREAGRPTEPWPSLRLLLSPVWDDALREHVLLYPDFAGLILASVHLRVAVAGLGELSLHHLDYRVDGDRPIEPFGSRPAVGARFHVRHPELARNRLDSLSLDLEWSELPCSLKAHYAGYPGVASASNFKADVRLVDRRRDLTVLTGASLFSEDAQGVTATARRIEIADLAATLRVLAPGRSYPRLLADDPTLGERSVCLELTPIDFGHGVYPELSATRAMELSFAIASETVKTAEQAATYRVRPPCVPKLKRARADYSASTAFDLPNPPELAEDRMLHVHPFGVSPVAAEVVPHFMPRYVHASELLLGLQDVRAPQRIALLVEMVAAASDGPAPQELEWSCLSGDRWVALDGKLVSDSTHSLANAGIVELDLPAVEPSTRLPGGLFWLRAASRSDPDRAGDILAIRAQATTATFAAGSTAQDPRPSPAGTIVGLLDPNPRIAAVEQPFASRGGRPRELDAAFYTRVSERLRHKQRALTPWDYERLVLERFPDIYKVRCLPGSFTDDAGERGLVDVIVIPDVRAATPRNPFAPRAPANLLADAQSYLQGLAPTHARVRVRNAQYVAVMARIAVTFAPGQDEASGKLRLIEDFQRFLSPWAFEEGRDIPIGGKIHAGSIIDFIDRREYVDHVTGLKLFRSLDGRYFEAVPETEGVGYHVAAERPDQILVAASEQIIDTSARDSPRPERPIGIDFMQLELDFILH